MTQKAEIIVEKFAQGITVRYKTVEDKSLSSKALAVVGSECGVIGKEIWKDVCEIFNDADTDRVRVKIEYQTLISTI